MISDTGIKELAGKDIFLDHLNQHGKMCINNTMIYVHLTQEILHGALLFPILKN